MFHPSREGAAVELTSRQRAHLRSLAHHLKPLLQVGADGVSDGFVRSLEEAFQTDELLKVKVLQSAPEDPRTSADQVAALLPGVHVTQTIGRTVVFYRRHPEEPRIRLPG